MSKICIIDVDLGLNVDEVIKEHLAEMSDEAKKQLDSAIAVATKTKELKEEKQNKKKKEDEELTGVMDKAYDKLEGAGHDGVLVEDIMRIVEGPVPNSSAFTLRMKKIMREKDSPYVLKRKKVNGKPRYIFARIDE